MRVLPARTALILGLGLFGFAFSIWLAVFFADAKRPLTAQERADLLAGENYRHLSLGSSIPPSPAHWEQSRVLLGDGVRAPLSRESSALVHAVTGGHRAASATLAFGFMSLALAWVGTRGGIPVRGLVPALCLVLLSVAHAWSWQIVDPTPFLIAGFSALFFGAWVEQRAGRNHPWCMGAGVAGLLFSAPLLGMIAALALGGDAWLSRRGAVASGEARPVSLFGLGAAVLVLPLVALFALGIRNWHATGSPVVSPTSAYLAKTSLTPTWLWQPIKVPPEGGDPVMERYDQLVALPASRWPVPVYQAWSARVVDGVRHAGGGVVALTAVVVLLFCPLASLRPVWLLAGFMSLTALLRHTFPAEWWCLLTPALLWSLVEGARHGAGGISRRRFATAVAMISLGQTVALAWEPQLKPAPAEYSFNTQLKEILEHLTKKGGKHLVFVSYDPSTDARLDAARLPREWRDEPILLARNLSSEQNAALVRAFPDRAASQIVVFPGRIGLLDWKPQSETGAPANIVEKETAPAETNPSRP